MGVDTQSICMFGKEFDDFEQALTHLKDRGLITEAEFDESLDYGEVQAGVSVDYQTRSCYSEEGGVLGIRLDNHNYQELTGIMETVKEEVGDDCCLHNFVYWY